MADTPQAVAKRRSDEVSTHSKFLESVAAVLATGAMTAGPAMAQDEWDLSFAPYLWATGIDGDATLGGMTAELEVNFSDIVHVLDGALLGHFEARKGDSGFFGDVIYLATERDGTDGETDTFAVEIELDTLILEAGYLHGRDNGGGFTGWEAGARYWDFEGTIEFQLIPGTTRSQGWTDAFIGYRRERPMGENWRSIVRGNIGAGGSDLTWGLDLTYLHDYDNGNSFAVGLKWLDIDYEHNYAQHLSLDAHFFGATIGYNFD